MRQNYDGAAPSWLGLELTLLRDGEPETQPNCVYNVSTKHSMDLTLHPTKNPWEQYRIQMQPVEHVDMRPWHLFYVTFIIGPSVVAQRRPLMVLEYATDLPCDVAVFWPSFTTDENVNPEARGVWSLAVRSTYIPLNQ